MMLRWMKYLLKIPLLAISMACNRSAREIKMIAASRPTTASAASPRPPPTTAILRLPSCHDKRSGTWGCWISHLNYCNSTMVRKRSECNYAWIECRLFDSLKRNEARPASHLQVAAVGREEFVFVSSVFLLDLVFRDALWNRKRIPLFKRGPRVYKNQKSREVLTAKYDSLT